MVHRLSSAYAGEPAAPGVLFAAPPDPQWFDGLPENFCHAAAAHAASVVQVVAGVVVSVCAAGDVTETLWDVGVDTLEAHRPGVGDPVTFRYVYRIVLLYIVYVPRLTGCQSLSSSAQMS